MYPPRLVRFSNSQRLFKFVANVADVQNCFPRPGGHIQISICLIIKLFQMFVCTFGFSSSYVVVIVSRGRMPVTVNTRVPVYVGERRSIYRQRERRSRTCSVASNEYLQFTVQQIQEHVQWTPLQCVRACVRACMCLHTWLRRRLVFLGAVGDHSRKRSSASCWGPTGTQQHHLKPRKEEEKPKGS